MAFRLGDDTALRRGRLTLNPLPAHRSDRYDPHAVLADALRAPVFGYARPVPVDYRKLRKPRVATWYWSHSPDPRTNILLAIGKRAVFAAAQRHLDGVTDETATPSRVQVVPAACA